MKELSIEEKAKRYDEVIPQLKGLLDGIHEEKCGIMEEDILEIFPELKESEDERIRKEIITYLSTVEDKELIPYEPWIAWLEKQCEKGTNGNEREIPYSEQKPADKIEPKLKVGDRIKFKGIHNEDVIRVITDIKEGEGVGFRYFFADGSIYPIGDDGVELVEEPVCKDLEKAAKDYSNNLDNIYGSIGEQTRNAFKAGANWQKEKDESTTEDLGEYINELSKQFPEVSFVKLSRIAVRIAKWQKEQIKKAMDLGEPPYLINIEQAYYRTLKLLEE